MPQKPPNEEKRRYEILSRLKENFPDVSCALNHRSAFELLVATILSAQCTDERVNMVTPELFARYPTAKEMAGADLEELQELIRSTGFFRNKAKNILGAAQKLERDFGGEIPQEMESLLTLPGVARKTANVVLGTWFGIAEGVVVDTHVGRIARRLEFTGEDDPKKVEQDLMAAIPAEEWIDFAHRLIHHGRQTCKSQRPRCSECFLLDVCPSALS